MFVTPRDRRFAPNHGHGRGGVDEPATAEQQRYDAPELAHLVVEHVVAVEQPKKRPAIGPAQGTRRRDKEVPHHHPCPRLEAARPPDSGPGISGVHAGWGQQRSSLRGWWPPVAVAGHKGQSPSAGRKRVASGHSGRAGPDRRSQPRQQFVIANGLRNRQPTSRSNPCPSAAVERNGARNVRSGPPCGCARLRLLIASVPRKRDRAELAARGSAVSGAKNPIGGRHPFGTPRPV